MQKNLLIAGIDPGTTVGYAIIDLNANIIKVGSSKQLDLSSLISELIKHGKIAVIGCDKAKTPDFVDKVATKLGSRMISPDEDLKITQKRELTKGVKLGNDHQMDALASAIFAYNQVKPLLRSVDELVKKTNKNHLRIQLTEIILHDPEFNIKSAIEILEQPEKPENRIMKKAIEEKIYDKRDFVRLFNRIKSLEQEILLLKKQKNNITESLRQSEKKSHVFLDILSKERKEEKVDSRIKIMEKRVYSSLDKMNQKDKDILQLKKDLDTLRAFVSGSNNKLILKKLNNLSNDEFKRKESILNISYGDVLLVKDTSIISYNVLDSIKDKVTFILTPTKSRSNSQVFKKYSISLLDAEKLSLEEERYFALADRQMFDDLVKKSDILDVIVKDYKDKRSGNV